MPPPWPVPLLFASARLPVTVLCCSWNDPNPSAKIPPPLVKAELPLIVLDISNRLPSRKYIPAPEPLVELPLTVLAVMVRFASPPAIPPPNAAVLPLMVLPVIVASVLPCHIAPPTPPGAELSLNAQDVIVKLPPRGTLPKNRSNRAKMPPPEAAELPLIVVAVSVVLTN